jgi:hypothetical protein
MASEFGANGRPSNHRSKTMFAHSQLQKTISMLTILSICPFFAACGGEEGEDNSASSSADSGGGAGAVVVCIAYLLVSGNDECLGYIGSSSSSGGSSNSGGSGSTGGSGATGGSGTTVASDDVIRFMPIDEYEPNNDWLNANPVEFPKTTDRDGFIINGDVHDALDPVDVFTFTRTFLRYHAFRLCWNGEMFCDETGEVDTPTAYIEILDQSGSILASTQASGSNYLRLELAGGVPYYVRVVADDTMAASLQYDLVVHEANY